MYAPNLSRLGDYVDIMAGPAHLSALVAGLDAHAIEHSVMVEDVQRLTEMAPMAKGSKDLYHDMDWDEYHPIEDMYSYFDYLGLLTANHSKTHDNFLCL